MNLCKSKTKLMLHWYNNTSNALPRREILPFDGNPLQFISFIRAFEHSVEEKTRNQDCLYFLEQYTRGQPRELVRSCLHMPPQQGYEWTKYLLRENFGNEYKLATAYKNKVMGWPAIKADEIQGLQEFSLFLRGCCNAMAEIQYMEEMNVPSSMRQIMMKWPYKLREKWRSTACEIQERQGSRVAFQDLVMFFGEPSQNFVSSAVWGYFRCKIKCHNKD